MHPAVGIDLGTTNTVVSVQTDSMGPTILRIPQPLNERRHLEALPYIKSAVFFENDQTAVVGAFASARMRSFKSIKSHMGTRWKAKHPCTAEFLTPAYISAHILRLAYQAVIEEYPDWDQTALITVPASFNTDQRYDTIAAARIAGFRNIRLLDEPTAAFYYFFNQHRESGEFREIRNVLVFDFGGGTLDVSVISINEQGNDIVLDAIGRSRYNDLGGDDIDVEIATFMLGCWEFENGKEVTSLPSELRRDLYQLFIMKSNLFKEEAEDYLKNDLGIPEFIIMEQLYISEQQMAINFKRTLSQSQYENITGRFLQSKTDLNIYRPIEEALSIACNIKPSFSRDDLDLILYTGGATNMLGVQRALRSYFAGKPCFSIDEEDACNTVALGAAACRYDEIYGKRNVKMITRLLESVFTRLPGSTQYTTLVPLTCEPSDNFNKVEGNFELKRPTIRLKLPLFRGVSSNDHQLVPMRDLEIPLDRALDEGTPYGIYYRMTANKTIDLKVSFSTPNGSIEAFANLDLFDNDIRANFDRTPCTINTI